MLDDAIEEDILIVGLVDFEVFFEGVHESFEVFDFLPVFQLFVDQVAGEDGYFWLVFELVEGLGILFIEFEICINKFPEKHFIVLHKRVETGSSIDG